MVNQPGENPEAAHEREEFALLQELMVDNPESGRFRVGTSFDETRLRTSRACFPTMKSYCPSSFDTLII